MPPQQPTVHVLGTAQDGGFPHAGCDCFSCEVARKDRSLRRRVASIGLVGESGQCLMVDATPDFPAQMSLLGEASGRGGPCIDALILTHAHIGHYLGLAFLGREVINADRVPVYCTRSMEQFLRTNRPWSHLVDRHDIEIRSIRPGEPLMFDGVEVEAFLTPHRGEDTDTIMLDLKGPERRLVYISDTDFFHDGLVARASEADVALLDGTYYSHREVKHREILEVKHPAIADSFELFEQAKGTIYFTHLNHTNALLHPTRAPDLPDGFALANDGMSFTL